MYETDNITFQCFVTRKCTIVVIDHKVQIIINIYKKARGHRADRLYFQLLFIIKHAQQLNI